MEIVLMRHGKAPTLVEAGVQRDEDRPLSSIGVDQARKAGKVLKDLDLTPERIVCSPFLRTRRTAEEARASLGDSVPLEVLPELASGQPTEALFDGLQAYAGDDLLLVVGHQPDLGELASLLLFGSDSEAIELKPGGMMLVDLPSMGTRGGGVLRWLLTPAQINRLGSS